MDTKKRIPRQKQEIRNIWSGQRDSDPRPSAWEADALPTELCPHCLVNEGYYSCHIFIWQHAKFRLYLTCQVPMPSSDKGYSENFSLLTQGFCNSCFSRSSSALQAHPLPRAIYRSTIELSLSALVPSS